MPNENNMSALVAIKFMKSEREAARRRFEDEKLMAARVLRASGSPSGILTALDAAAKRVDDAYEYAIASMTLSRKSGKSALKECQRQGLVVGFTGDYDAAHDATVGPPQPRPVTTLPVYDDEPEDREEY